MVATCLNPTMQRIFSYSLLLLAWLFTACNEATSIDPDEEEVSGLHSIAYLKSLCDEGEELIRESVIIQGVVTANDLWGEMERQFTMQDETGGLTVNLEATRIFEQLPIGTRLHIYCTGLTLRNYGGRIELGDQADAYGRYGIPQEDFTRYIRKLQPAESEPQPRPCTFHEISAAWVDCYVRFDGVAFIDKGCWCNTDPVSGELQITEHTIQNETGEQFTVRVLPSCHYASEPLPAGKGSLYGIIDHFNGRYALRVVNYGIFFR